MTAPRRRPTVLVNETLLAGRATGPLFGYHHPATAHYNVLSCGARRLGRRRSPRVAALGELHEAEPGHKPEGKLVGFYAADGVTFSVDGRPCKVERYSLTRDVFSRNSGILESGRLLECRAIFSGCGSVGSLVALELARVGVGKFVLTDPDVMAYHNLCRHQCGITARRPAQGRGAARPHPGHKPGRRDRRLCGRPGELTRGGAAGLLRPEVADPVLRDNREGDLNANQISCLTHTPLLSIGLWETGVRGGAVLVDPADDAVLQLRLRRRGGGGVGARLG